MARPLALDSLRYLLGRNPSSKNASKTLVGRFSKSQDLRRSYLKLRLRVLTSLSLYFG